MAGAVLINVIVDMPSHTNLGYWGFNNASEP
jgi:hypothetical protein